MAEEKKYRKEYGAEDIQRYLSGVMSTEEMNAMEKAALEDPFLADAMEGYSTADPAQVHADLDQLKARLSGRTNLKSVSINRNRRIWWSAAAAVILVLGIGSTYYWLSQPAEKNIAQNKEKHEANQPAAPEELKTVDTPNSKIAKDSKREFVLDTQVSKRKNGEREYHFSKKDSINSGQVSIEDRENSALNLTRDSSYKKSDDDKVKSRESVPAIASANANNELSKKAGPSANFANAYANSDKSITTHLFTGRIRDSNNNAIPFANIRINYDNKNSTYSDAKGNFKLFSGDSILKADISSVGYEPTEVVLYSKNKTNNITLALSKSALDEVVVTGMAAKKSRAKNEVESDQPDANPVDGWENYDIYLANNTRVPYDAMLRNLHGEVELSFNVNATGILSDFKIEHSVSAACDAEAIRLVKEGPKWQLAKGRKYANITIAVSF